LPLLLLLLVAVATFVTASVSTTGCFLSLLLLSPSIAGIDVNWLCLLLQSLPMLRLDAIFVTTFAVATFLATAGWCHCFSCHDG